MSLPPHRSELVPFMSTNVNVPDVDRRCLSISVSGNPFFDSTGGTYPYASFEILICTSRKREFARRWLHVHKLEGGVNRTISSWTPIPYNCSIRFLTGNRSPFTTEHVSNRSDPIPGLSFANPLRMGRFPTFLRKLVRRGGFGSGLTLVHDEVKFVGLVVICEVASHVHFSSFAAALQHVLRATRSHVRHACVQEDGTRPLQRRPRVRGARGANKRRKWDDEPKEEVQEKADGRCDGDSCTRKRLRTWLHDVLCTHDTGDARRWMEHVGVRHASNQAGAWTTS